MIIFLKCFHKAINSKIGPDILKDCKVVILKKCLKSYFPKAREKLLFQSLQKIFTLQKLDERTLIKEQKTRIIMKWRISLCKYLDIPEFLIPSSIRQILKSFAGTFHQA